MPYADPEVARAYHRQYGREHYLRNKETYKDSARRARPAAVLRAAELVTAHLREHPCVDCGQVDLVVLQFDHRDPATKEYEISQMINWGLSVRAISKEIELCDVRCANCHVKRTRQQFGWKLWGLAL